jgi:DNA helicase HerA-like ATPase
VSGTFGSQVITHNDATRCSPGAPRGAGTARANSKLRRARHIGSISAMTALDQQLCTGAHALGSSVVLDPAERRRHLYVVGQTGTGKSTLLLNLIRQDLLAGEGVVLLDPHGDLALAALGHVPKSEQ